MRIHVRGYAYTRVYLRMVERLPMYLNAYIQGLPIRYPPGIPVGSLSLQRSYRDQPEARQERTGYLL